CQAWPSLPLTAEAARDGDRGERLAEGTPRRSPFRGDPPKFPVRCAVRYSFCLLSAGNRARREVLSALGGFGSRRRGSRVPATGFRLDPCKTCTEEEARKTPDQH